MTDISTPAVGLMAGKRGLITGVANEKSIAWGIARHLANQGAELAFSYPGPAMEKRVRPLAESLGSTQVFECDVEAETGADNGIQAAADRLKSAWGQVDFILHSIAYSDREELKGRYADTTRENFNRSLHISCFSLTEMARAFAPLMTNGGSIATLTFIGSRQTLPNYNVMGVAKAALEASVRYLAADLGPLGIRINAISPGPMRTISGAAISSARQIFNESAEMAPLGRNPDVDEAGRVGLYMLSDLSSGVTGTVHHVDGGFHATGLGQASL